MRIDILTALPRLLDSWFNESILERAQKKGLVEVKVHDLRDHSTDKHRRLDDYPFGGGAGMVMTIEPIHRCIDGLKAERAYDEVIYMSPDGELLDQPLANQNFLIISANNSCPTDVAADPAAGDYVNSNTRQHQP